MNNYFAFLNRFLVGKTLIKINPLDEGKYLSFLFSDKTSVLIDSGGGDNGELIPQVRNGNGEPDISFLDNVKNESSLDKNIDSDWLSEYQRVGSGVSIGDDSAAKSELETALEVASSSYGKDFVLTWELCAKPLWKLE